MSRFWKVVLWVVIVAALLLGISVHMLHRQASRVSPHLPSAVPVAVLPVIKQDVPIYLNGLGTVVAHDTVTISPQVSGQLLSINFKEGARVKRGQLLAHIDPRRFQAAYDQALAKQRQAQAQLATTRSNYQRSLALLAKGYIAKQDLEKLHNAVIQDRRCWRRPAPVWKRPKYS